MNHCNERKDHADIKSDQGVSDTLRPVKQETKQLVFGTNSNHLCVDSVEDENSELKAVNYKVK